MTSSQQPHTRQRSGGWLAKTMLSATLLAGAQAACVSLANSVACPSFSTLSIDNVTLIANFKMYGIVLQPFATREEFDKVINNATSFQPFGSCSTYNSAIRIPYQNTILCTIAVHDESSAQCNQNAPEMNVDMCITSCKTYEQGFANLAPQLCPGDAAWATGNNNDIKKICSGTSKDDWPGLQSTANDCINSDVNEAAFCGLATLGDKCTFCNTNATATCCKDAGTACPKPSTTAVNPETTTSFIIPPSNNPTDSNSPSGSGLSTTALKAIIGGSVGAVVLAALILFLCVRRSRKSTGGKKGNDLSRQMSNSSGRYNISAPKVQEQGFAAAMATSAPIPMNTISSGASDRSSLGAAVAAAGGGAAVGAAVAAGDGGREANGKQSYCQALYPYQASMADELDLTPGDIVNVQRVFDDGWAVGVNMNTSNEGAFPVVCVMFVDESALEDDFEDVNMHSMTPMTLREEDEGRRSPSGRNSPRSSLPSRSSSPVHLPRRNSSIRDSTVIIPGLGNGMTSSPLAGGAPGPGGRMTPPARDTMLSDASSINRWWDGENAR
ncbi:hypothetical protein BGZ95_011543 [Linnemannia exigua]|uniref:SH3 domain-containing protein n=1 Tax=Linnemannia exigua TaxID=604196 RepID=A0AAD4H5J5_9FUNG|nr:hypothetical protein BGZ95_011543 [Linnemannia exigua]